MQTYTDVDQAIERSQSHHDEIVTVETDDVRGSIELAKARAVGADLTYVGDDEPDGRYGVAAFGAHTPDGQHVWRIAIVADDDAIRALRSEARAQGDESLVDDCDEALAGDTQSRHDVCATIRDAAMA